MNFFKPLLLVSSLFLASSNSWGLNFSNFYFVGDSLTDLGNNDSFALCFDGPCTNPPGFTWAHYLGSNFGQTVIQSNAGGTDYAYIGAPTRTTPYFTDPNLTVNGQIIRLIADQGGHLDNQALYSILAGADNFLDVVLPPAVPPTGPAIAQLPTVSEQTSSDIIWETNQLHAAGGRNLLVGNLPDYTKTPLFQDLIYFFNIYTAAEAQQVQQLGVIDFNNLLRTKLNALPYDVIQVDFYSLLQDMLTNPGSYGFTNTTIACADLNNCQGYLYVFLIHPTTYAHQVIADYVTSVLRGPEFYANMARVSLTMLGNQNRAIKQQLLPNIKANPAQAWHLFATGDLSNAHYQDWGNTLYPAKASSLNGTIGFTQFVHQNFEWGGAYTRGHGNPAMQNNAGSFSYDDNLFSLFGSYFHNNYYFNTILNGGNLNFNRIQRRFLLGPRQVITQGNTSGNYYAANFETGLLWQKNESVSTGPYLTADLAQLIVNGYQEVNAPIGVNLAYNRQRDNNVLSGLGWRVQLAQTLAQSELLSNLYLSVNRQWLHADRTLYFHVISLPGSHGALPIGLPATNYFTAGFNIANLRSNGLVLSLGYDVNVGNQQFFAQNLNFAVSVPLGS